jgi:hypothetical protein
MKLAIKHHVLAFSMVSIVILDTVTVILINAKECSKVATARLHVDPRTTVHVQENKGYVSINSVRTVVGISVR